MTSCCPPPRMPWSGATGAIARGKRVSTGCGRTSRSVRAWRWTCGVKPTPKAGNKPSPPFIVHGLDKPGGFTTVSNTATDTVVTTVPFDLGLDGVGIGSAQGSVYQATVQQPLNADGSSVFTVKRGVVP